MSRSRERRAPWALALAAAVALGAAAAQPLTLRVLGPTAPIAPGAITGFNVAIAMTLALHLGEFGAMTIRSVRFPPGNDADDKLLNEAAMDAFRLQWALLGEPDVLLVANFFAGPEHAAEVARYLATIGVPVRWWSVGNEPDLYPRNRMDPSWTAEVYCDRFRELRAAVQAVQPDAVMTGPAVSGSRPSALGYLREVLGRCGDVIDVLTWHVYPTDGSWSDEAALATARSIGDEIPLLRGWLTDPEVNPLGFERDIGLAITEFGLSWRTSMYRHLEDQVAALWLADALGQMATYGLDASHYFALQAMGGHGLIDRGGWIRPTYHVYAMLADFAGWAHAVEGADDRLGAYAAADGAALRVLLVNRSTDDVAVSWAFEDASAGYAAPHLEVTTLVDPVGYDPPELLHATHGIAEPLVVPARAAVLVRRDR
jgi:ABC-type amino acid transport substrate-binding protein